jgi:hypothetical protein
VSDVKTEPTIESAGAEAPKYITKKEIEALLKARDSDAEERLNTRFGKLEALLTKREPDADAARAADPAHAKGLAAEDSPAYKSLQKRLTETEATVAAEKKARADAEARSADARLRQQLRDALIASGVDAKAAGHVVMILVDGEKRARLDDHGEVVFREGPDEVTLDTGLKGWLSSEEAARYLPPRGTAGSGDRPAGRAAPVKSSGGATYEQLAVQFQQALQGSSGGIAVG